MDSSTAIWFARALFWVFAAGCLFSSKRTAISWYLLLIQIDASGPFFESTGSIGFENLLRIVAIPAAMAYRYGLVDYVRRPWSIPAGCWAGLAMYAVIASMWSPYPISAVKMVGYFASYLLLVPVLLGAWREGAINRRMLFWNVVLVLLMGVFQTYILDNPFGSLEEKERFTTFTAPQALAAYMLSVLAALSIDDKPDWHNRFGRILCIAGILLTGSRYVFVGMIAFFMVRSLMGKSAFTFAGVLKRLTAFLVAVALCVSLISTFAPESRVNELIQTAKQMDLSGEEIGTWIWRLAIYNQAFAKISQWTRQQYLIGAGTSASGEVILAANFDFLNESNVDANRAMHNEFLRVFYEWGIIGILLFLGFLVSIFASAWREARLSGSKAAIAVVAMAPAILSSLAIENLLANPGAPGGTGYLLCFTMGLAFATRRVTSPAAFHASCGAPLPELPGAEAKN